MVRPTHTVQGITMTTHRAHWFALLLLVYCAATQAQAAEPSSATAAQAANAVVVTMAPNRPPCANAYAAAEQNCYGTRATTHSFPVPLDALLWFPQQPSDRISWVFVGPVVVQPANLARALWLQIERSEDGQYALSAGVDDQTTSATMAAATWTPVQIPLEQRFWVRIDPTQAEPQ